MQSLSDRIRAFLKLADACLEWFDSATPPIEPHPLFAGITPPKGFDGQEDYSEALDTIPQAILENGGWENELIEQARSIAGELARHEWGKDAVKTLLAFIRVLKQRRSIDRALWQQVRADLEDAAELLRIDGSKADSGKADSGKRLSKQELDAKLRPFLAENPEATAEQAADFLGLKNKGRLSEMKLPSWNEHVTRKKEEKPPSKGHAVPMPKDADKLFVAGQQHKPRDPRRDALHSEAMCEDGDLSSNPERLRSFLLNVVATEYRAGVNKLKPADLSALLAHLRDTLSSKPLHEQTELVCLAAEQWLDEHR